MYKPRVGDIVQFIRGLGPASIKHEKKGILLKGELYRVTSVDGSENSDHEYVVELDIKISSIYFADCFEPIIRKDEFEGIKRIYAVSADRISVW
jgi:hypothetical protein